METEVVDRVEALWAELATLTDEGPGAVIRRIANAEVLEAEMLLDFLELAVPVKSPELREAMSACRRGEHRA